MKAYKLLLFCLAFLPATLLGQNESFNDFVPVGPAPIDYKVKDGRLFSEISQDESNNELVINLLPNELTHKSVTMIGKDGSLRISALELSEKGATYIVNTDFIKYTTLPVRKDAETGEIIGVARVGVGLRVVATIHTHKAHLTVTDLYSLGTQVKKKALSGHITLSVMGVESEAVTYGFPVNAEITPTSIASVIQAQTIVKNSIYDRDSHLTPQILQIKYTQDFRDAAANVGDLAMPILLSNRGEPCVVIK